MQLLVHHSSVARLVKARHLTTPSTVVGLFSPVVNDIIVMVVESAIVAVVVWGAALVPTIAVVASWIVVLLASAVVVPLLH